MKKWKTWRPCKDWKQIKRGGYFYAKIPEHPNASSRNYVYEHRVVMENSIKRFLTSFEVVHHINGNGKDNRIENLLLTIASEHTAGHNKENAHGDITLECDFCKKMFKRGYHNRPELKKNRNNFCCRECMYSFLSNTLRGYDRVFNGKYHCSTCKQYLLKQDFHRNCSRRFGISGICKNCFNKYVRKRGC